MSVSVGERIRELLKKNGMTQVDLAEKCGLTSASVSRYVCGRRIPNGNTIAKIATSLHVTADYLLGNDNECDPETAYSQVKYLTGRNAGKWNGKEKADLVNAIFQVV